MHLQLCHDQPVINALFLHQLIMGAGFRDGVMIDHHNTVRVPQGGKAVGNGKGGAALGQAAQRLLNLVLCFGIQAASGFVQNQQPGIMQNRPGDGNPLPFPAGQGIAGFPHIGIVSSGNRTIKSWAFAILAARIISCGSASGLA